MVYGPFLFLSLNSIKYSPHTNGGCKPLLTFIIYDDRKKAGEFPNAVPS